MKCYICNTYIETPVIDPRDNKVKPCTVCLDIVERAAHVSTEAEDRLMPGEIEIIPLEDYQDILSEIRDIIDTD